MELTDINKHFGQASAGRAGRVARLLIACLLGGALTNVPAQAPSGRLAGRSPRLQRVEHPTVDAGDSYLSPQGRRSLLRLAGAVVVRAENVPGQPNAIQELTRAGSPLADWRVAWTAGRGYVVLQPAERQRVRELSEPARLRETLAATRRAPGLSGANPVFVDPKSRLWLVPTPEIIVRLRPGTDPAGYFGAAWPATRRLAGTRDQFVVRLAGAPTAEAMLAEVNRHAADPRVAWAEPNFIGQALRQGNDPYFPAQWHLHNTGQSGGVPNADLNAPEAWQITPGRPAIVIALLDDGLQLDHPDLAANLFLNPDEDGWDADGNGYEGDWNGWDFFDDDNDPSPADPLDDHGTATAGVAAAVGDNLLGGAGVAPGCQLMPLKVIRGAEGVEDALLAEAIYYAAGSTRDGQGFWRGADVISLSLAFYESQAVNDALSWAARNGRGGYGCPIFAAAGNNASRWDTIRTWLPVGLTLGPGTYSFAFEYAKDESDADGEDLIQIDNVALLKGDGFTVLNSALGPGGRQEFEGATFPPPGWETLASSTRGGLPWSVSTNRALTGTGGARSARSGFVPHNSWTRLFTPFVTLAGDELLSFSVYSSTEGSDFDEQNPKLGDGLYVVAFDRNDTIVAVFPDPDTDPFPLVSGSALLYTPVEYPASHPDVSGVGAATDCNRRADYSQYGPGLDFLAPSSGGWGDILTTDRTGASGFATEAWLPTLNYYFNFGGTSAAAPVAAGVGALLLSANPLLTAADVRALMRTNCAKIGGVTYTNGWHPLYGHGRLNAFRALKWAVPDLQTTLAAFPDPVAVGSRLLCTATITNRGPVLAEEVILTCYLPSNAAFVAASTADYSLTNDVLDLFLGNLAPGQGTSAWFVLAPQGQGRPAITVFATSYALDLNPSNDWATVSPRVAGPDTVPPAITITAPEANARLTNATVSAAGTATDNAGVAAVEYWLSHPGGVTPPVVLSNAPRVGPFAWAAEVSGLFPGTNVLHARAWDASGNPSAEATRSFFYAVKSRLRILLAGAGTVTPAWTNSDLALNRNFTVSASPAAGFLFSNWVGRLGAGGPVQFVATSTQLTFRMVSNLVLEAHFVPSPFPPFRGTINGLFYTADGVRQDRAGSFTLTVGNKGGYLGQVRAGAATLSVTGAFDLEGRASNTLLRNGTNYATVEWNLNLAGAPTNDLWGTVLGANGAWAALLLGDRAPVCSNTLPSPYRGKYTFIIPGARDPAVTNWPAGDGFGTVSVSSNGWLDAAGTLADGTPFTQGLQLCGHGQWPLYVPLYQGGGSLLAWVTLDPQGTPAQGLGSARLSWIKPPATNGNYRAGFEVETTLLGSRYTRPNPMVPFTNGLMTFLGGTLPEPLSNRCVRATSANTWASCLGTQITLSLARSNGTFSGTLALPHTNRLATFRGAWLQAQTNGFGHFRHAGQSGWVTFGP